MSPGLERFAELLERAGYKVVRHRDGTKFDFSCPLHADKTPSAGAKPGDRGAPVVAHCMPCGKAASLPAMLDQLNAPPEDRHLILGGKPVRHDSTPGTVIHHVYPDARGVPQMRLNRRLDANNKTAVKPDGKKDITRQYYYGGEWCWPNDIPESARPKTAHLVYNLPAVLEAVKRGGSVHIGEGERVCDALNELGLVATCNASGAGHWYSGHAEQLRGARRAIVWVDNDESGEKHAIVVAKSLATVGIADVRLVRFADQAEHYDLADWAAEHRGKGLKRGQVQAELKPLLAAATPWVPQLITPPQNGAARSTTPEILENSEVLLPKPSHRAPFPADVLPGSCRRLVEEGAKARGVDPAYLGVPMLAALAGAIGNTAQLRVRRDYSEPAILWTVVVAPSGTMKSPQLELVFRPYRDRDRRLVELNREKFAEYQRARAHYQFASRSGQSAERPERPRVRSLLVSDPTVEALASRLEDNPRGLTLVRDELSGLIAGLDQYKRAHGSDVTFYLEAYHGREAKIDRKNADQPTIYIRRASLSIAGTTQPGVLERAIGRDGRENGLLARMFVASPPAAYPRWTEHDIAQSTFENYDRTIGALLDLDLPPSGDPAQIGLSAEAYDLWRVYHDQMMARMETAPENLRAAFSKLRGGALRIALVVAYGVAAEEGRAGALREVDAASMAAGTELSGWFADEAERSYGTMTESPEEAHNQRRIEWMEAHGPRFAPRDLLSHGPLPRFTNADDADLFLRGLAKRGYGRLEEKQPGPQGGRPSVVFVMTPTSRSKTSEIPTNPEVLLRAAQVPLGDVSGSGPDGAQEVDDDEALTPGAEEILGVFEGGRR